MKALKAFLTNVGIAVVSLLVVGVICNVAVVLGWLLAAAWH